MRILVSICSYRDPLLPHTIKSMMQNKSSRHEVTYAIFEQTAYQDSLECNEEVLTRRTDVIYKRIDPQYSDGCVWARYINLLNVNEDYDFIYQIDSHILHDKDWDRSLVEDYKRARDIAGTNKVIITGACKSFEIEETEDEIITIIHGSDDDITTKVGYYRIDKDTLIPGAHGEQIPATKMPQPGFHILAGNFFTHIDWVHNVGLNPRVFFEGEEVLMSMMSYENGYQVFHHTKTVSYHLKDTLSWPSKQHVNPVVIVDRMQTRKERGKMVWKEYLETCREDMLEDFYRDYGVDFINLKIDERARSEDPGKELGDVSIDHGDASREINNEANFLPKPLFLREES